MLKRSLFVSVMLIVLTSLLVIPVIHPQDTPQTETALAQAGVLTEVYNRVSPSVVAISVVARRPNTGFFGQDNEVIGGGSGFVIDTEGHIVTNNHVVDGATRIEVMFLDGTLARAQVVGLDPDSDLAVLKVDLPAERLQPVEWGDSDALVIGQPVVAIGSPFGQRWTLTSGIISALERTIQGLTNFSIGGVIQTDAPINPGNSGGPLLDLQGRVIGVNSQIISATRSSAGIGFAIPSNLARRVSQALIEDGFVSYSYLGITGGDVTLTLIEALDLPNNTRGVVVRDVAPGGPGARAGLQSPGGETVEVSGSEVPTEIDIITAINGEPLNGIGSLISYLARETEPGDTVTLSVLRNGTERLELTVRLTPRP
ncbi:MAG TPA: trypsin-like peptidase domain-containing protein [Spirillospora sp.]|nr:trypsin-like peptidase domain-containing protein [Spirillospora sp.]